MGELVVEIKWYSISWQEKEKEIVFGKKSDNWSLIRESSSFSLIINIY